MCNLNDYRDKFKNIYRTYVNSTKKISELDYENTYNINDEVVNFDKLYNLLFIGNLDIYNYCFDSESGMGKSHTIRKFLNMLTINNKYVLYINFSDDNNIKFNEYSPDNTVNDIFKINKIECSFNDIKNYGNGKNVYVLFDNIKKLTIMDYEKLKNIITSLNNNKIVTVMDYDIATDKTTRIKINSIYNSNDNLDDMLNVNILYILYEEMKKSKTNSNYIDEVFSDYQRSGQLLWNYYNEIVRTRVDSNEYRYICDYIVPYLGYMLCYHTDLQTKYIMDISENMFTNIFKNICEFFPSEFNEKDLYDALKLVPIINVQNGVISFTHDYFTNFASALHLLNNDLIYLKTGNNPLLKGEQRTTDDNYLVTDLYVDLYNNGIDDVNGFLIRKLNSLVKGYDNEMYGRLRNIINDIIFYPIYNRHASLENIGNLPKVLNDKNTEYGLDDFGQWSKAFCLEKIARLYYLNDNYELAKSYLLESHNALIGILNRNTDNDYSFDDIKKSNIEQIINNYDENMINEKRVYHILGKIYSNYEKITNISSAYEFYKIASSQSHFSCNLLGQDCEKKGDYNQAENYYQKSIAMGDLWANKAIVNLYLKADFNKFYESNKSLEERNMLVEQYLKNISYSNVSNIFITVYKADVLKKIVSYCDRLKENAEFDYDAENRLTDNIIKENNIFDDFVFFIFTKIEEITDNIYKDKTCNKEDEFRMQIKNFYISLNILELFLTEKYPEVIDCVSGICMGIGTKDRYISKSIGVQDDLNSKSRDIDENSIFDLASVTKLYTSIVVNILCQDDTYKMNFDSKIKDLDSKFINLGETTINDLLTFKVKVQTDGRLLETDTNLDKIYNCTIVEKYQDPYTDIGAIILELVIKKVTGKTLDDWVMRLIVDKIEDCNISAQIKDIKLAVSNDSEYRDNGYVYCTDLGQVHDSKARMLNKILYLNKQKCHGHAGLFASFNDLGRFCQALLKDEIVNRETLIKIATNCTGSYQNDKFTKYLGELCYSKHPIAKKSEVPYCFSNKSIGCGGYTGNHLCIDTKNEVFTILLSNRCNNRSTGKDSISEIKSTSTFAYDRERLVNKLALLALEQKFIDILKSEIDDLQK